MRYYIVRSQVTAYITVHYLPREAEEGSLAYVSERGGELYVRTQKGWRMIQVRMSGFQFTNTHMPPFRKIELERSLFNRNDVDGP